jgi:small subunit ribosomal protein S16
VEIDTDKARDWIAKGAQPTEAVSNLLAIAGVEGFAERKAAAKADRAKRYAKAAGGGARKASKRSSAS